MSHTYVVVSPETLLHMGSEVEPPEYGPAVAEVRADTKQEAIRKAIDDPAMKAWVAEARADGMPPFAGLIAEPFHCPHGVCLCDQDGDDLWLFEPCDECLRFAMWVDSLRDYAMREGLWDLDGAICDWANAREVPA